MGRRGGSIYKAGSQRGNDRHGGRGQVCETNMARVRVGQGMAGQNFCVVGGCILSLTLRLLMLYIYIYIYIYIYMERLFLMFLDHTQRRTTVGRTPLDE